MTNIYLIRHGFTPANNAKYNHQEGIREIAEDRYMPLERDYGIRQAEEAGEFLKNIVNGKILAIVSPYRRTLETFLYASRVMDKNMDILIDERIREINSGVHYARTIETVKKYFPETSEFFKALESDMVDSVPYYGGESQNDVRDRVFSFAMDVLNICDSEDYDNILIFTHGTAMHWIYYWLNNGDELKTGLKNCEIIKANGDNSGKSLFIPVAYVPKGFLIDIPKYIDLVNNDKEFKKVKTKILNK